MSEPGREEAAGASAESAPLAEPGPGVQLTLLGWCLWLLTAWLVALWVNAATPAVRWMVFASVVGLMLAWPAVRLAQVRPADVWAMGEPARGRLILLLTFLEWLCLVLVFQAVIWPLGLVARWELEQTLWLDTAVLGWSLVIAALTAWGCQSTRGGVRAVAMAACVLVVVGEPAAVALWTLGASEPMGPAWAMRVSPVQTLWALTHEGALWDGDPWRIRAGTAAAAGVLAWALLPVLVRWRAAGSARAVRGAG